MFGPFLGSLKCFETHPDAKCFYIVANEDGTRVFINTPSFFPTHEIEYPFRDPFTEMMGKVKFHNSMKMAEQTAERLTESYDHALDMMKDRHDNNLEELRNPSQNWALVNHGSIAEYVQHLKDRNIFYHDKIIKLEKSRPKTIKAYRVIAMCMIT